jgi:DNA adenine methylase
MRAVQNAKQLALPAQGDRPSLRTVPRPFVKWVGGKGQLLPTLRREAPKSFGRYFEPFVGGGALFFALKPVSAVLTDVNEELISAYTAIRDDVESVIKALLGYEYDKGIYYKVRALDPRSLPPADRAARTLYLNRTGFNGLYRVNKSGGFNVPFGRYANPLICDPTNLRACSAALANVELAVRPFHAVLEHAAPGDFVYFDPPYLPVSRTADFTAYAAGGFGLAEHERLALVARELVARGVRVLLSNADVPAARKLFKGAKGFKIKTVEANRTVSATAGGRVPVTEILVKG